MTTVQAQRFFLRKRLAMMIAAVPLLYSHGAQADTSSGGGIFVGYSFSDKSFDWGIEGYTLNHDPCTDCGTETAMGPVLRLSFHGLSPHLSLTGLLGVDMSGTPTASSVGVELGVSMSLSRAVVWDFVSAAYVENIGLNAYIRRSWKTRHMPIGAGMRTPTTNTLGTVSVGRPFRDTSGRSQRAWTPDGQDTTVQGAHWLSRALDECASIPAFLQLAEELLDLGAPNELVQRALDAAADELRHTRMTTQLARRYGATHTTPTPPVYTRRPALERSQQLSRLAQESWLDGCLGEGAAAAVAGAEASTALDVVLRTTQSEICKDDTGHASLAQDILRWTISLHPPIAAEVRRERLRILSTDSMTLSETDLRSVLRHSHSKARDFLSLL